MQKQPKSGIGSFAVERKFRKNWKRIAAFLSCMVILSTLSALTLPAVTLDRYTCGKEEHGHDFPCYDARMNLICGKEEHLHTDACTRPILVILPPGESTEPSAPESRPDDPTQPPSEPATEGPPESEPPETLPPETEATWPRENLSDTEPDPDADPMAETAPGETEPSVPEDYFFDVQCYAYLNRGKDVVAGASDENVAHLVDTRDDGDGDGGKMPTNVTGSDADKNPLFNAKWLDLPLTKDGAFQLDYDVPTEIFTPSTYNLNDIDTIHDIYRLEGSPYYQLESIWVLIPGCEANDNAANWKTYPVTVESGGTITPQYVLTINEALQDSNVIYLPENAIVRLNHRPKTSPFLTDTTFWDYDISDGKIYTNAAGTTTTTKQNLTSKVYMKTAKYGINGTTDLVGSGDARLAFGNNNAGMSYAGVVWEEGGTEEVTINKARRDANHSWSSGKPANNHGCSFGIVTGLDAQGNLIYADGITAPKLFNEGPSAGKTQHDGWQLEFYRYGDTYTLSAVQNPSGTTVLKDLTKLFQYATQSNPSNNFWPMDYVDYWETASKEGMTYNANAPHDLVFGSKANVNNRNFINASGGTGTLPVGDDGNDHNSYFGMEFAVDFSVTADYVGPLEYAFFGDDDMWVFLNDTLICDIGGVHTSVGSYVDLWDWIPKGTAGDYTLTIYYTERGASGSTCWINFTLPSATFHSDDETGSLEFTKTLSNPDEISIDPEQRYTFQVNLYESEGGAPLDSNLAFNVKIYEGEKLVDRSPIVKPGGTVKLKANQRAEITGIPVDTYFTVVELDHEIYDIIYEREDDKVYEGHIYGGSISDLPSEAVFTNTPKVGSIELRKTLVNPDGALEEDMLFPFMVDMAPAEDGSSLSPYKDYLVEIFDQEDNLLRTQTITIIGDKPPDGGTALATDDIILLGSGETARIDGIPVRTNFIVSELDGENFTTTMIVDGISLSGQETLGTIGEGVSTVHFQNTIQTGTVELSKTVTDPEGEALASQKTFEFRFDLADSTGSPLHPEVAYPVHIYREGTLVDDTQTVTTGGTFLLKAGHSARILELPIGADFTLTELTRGGYVTTIRTGESLLTAYTHTGSVAAQTDPVHFFNSAGTVLPETGGPGTKPHIFGGWLLLCGATCAYILRRKQGRREGRP